MYLKYQINILAVNWFALYKITILRDGISTEDKSQQYTVH
jgi:hypothetical protein